MRASTSRVQTYVLTDESQLRVLTGARGRPGRGVAQRLPVPVHVLRDGRVPRDGHRDVQVLRGAFKWQASANETENKKQKQKTKSEKQNRGSAVHSRKAQRGRRAADASKLEAGTHGEEGPDDVPAPGLALVRHAPHVQSPNLDRVRAERQRLEHVRARPNPGIEYDLHLWTAAREPRRVK